MDQHSKNIELWNALSKAVYDKNWDQAQFLAEQLMSSFDGVKHLDGVYSIGFQHLARAPEKTKQVILKYNQLLSLNKSKYRKKKKKGKQQ